MHHRQKARAAADGVGEVCRALVAPLRRLLARLRAALGLDLVAPLRAGHAFAAAKHEARARGVLHEPPLDAPPN